MKVQWPRNRRCQRYNPDEQDDEPGSSARDLKSHWKTDGQDSVGNRNIRKRKTNQKHLQRTTLYVPKHIQENNGYYGAHELKGKQLRFFVS